MNNRKWDAARLSVCCARAVDDVDTPPPVLPRAVSVCGWRQLLKVASWQRMAAAPIPDWLLEMEVCWPHKCGLWFSSVGERPFIIGKNWKHSDSTQAQVRSNPKSAFMVPLKSESLILSVMQGVMGLEVSAELFRLWFRSSCLSDSVEWVLFLEIVLWLVTEVCM